MVSTTSAKRRSMTSPSGADAPTARREGQGKALVLERQRRAEPCREVPLESTGRQHLKQNLVERTRPLGAVITVSSVRPDFNPIANDSVTAPRIPAARKLLTSFMAAPLPNGPQ